MCTRLRCAVQLCLISVYQNRLARLVAAKLIERCDACALWQQRYLMGDAVSIGGSSRRVCKNSRPMRISGEDELGTFDGCWSAGTCAEVSVQACSRRGPGRQLCLMTCWGVWCRADF